VAPLGAGGMGVVYRARDTRLDRTVAVKVLPEHVAAEPDLRQRLEREARAISSLNHPHICTLHDVGREGEIDYLVMEYLEGESLASRLTRGPLPLQQALQIATQMADALATAHKAGIVHRDLKPGNIMLTKSGAARLGSPQAKLLDFGLAKRPATPGSVALTEAPTVTSPLTGAGTIVGTIQYMAPEQLEGQEADARSDIFAFGAVLYEMLTGRKAFEGKSQASLIAAIMQATPPPVATLQPLTPPALENLVTACLAKEPDDRWQSAGDIARQLKWMTSADASSNTAALPAGPGKTPARRPLVPALIAVAVLAIAALGFWAFTREAVATPPPAVSRLLLTPAPTAPLVNVGGFDAVISPDGRNVVYLGQREDGSRALYLREIGGLDPRQIAGTDMPGDFANANPFFSWDGASVGFRLPGRGIMRVPVAGGTLAKIADDDAGFVGGAWGEDDTVVAALVRGGTESGLYRVSASGGRFERITRPLPAGQLYVAPALLPGGRAVLAQLIEVQPPKEQIVVVDLATGDSRVIGQGANPMFASSGHLVFAQGTTLMAVAFDPVRLTMVGNPAPVVEGVRHIGLVTAADYSLSSAGTLVYIPAADVTPPTTLVWVDRSGRVIGPALPASIEGIAALHLSPDGRRVALTRESSASDPGLWVYDLEGRPPVPLSDVGNSRSPLWSPDGQQIFFSSDGGGGLWEIYSQAADGSSAPVRVPSGTLDIDGSLTGLSGRLPSAWLPDGRLIFTVLSASGGGGDLLAVPPEGAGSPAVVLRTTYGEDSPSVSPDGSWLAYRSTRTGRSEIWAMGIDGTTPVRVSQNGGSEPQWSRDGRELFYLEGNRMMAAGVRNDRQTPFEPARVLFDAPFFHFPLRNFILTQRSYDVAPDGRFLMLRAEQAAAAPAPSSIVVVQNWTEELKRLVPVQ
jgi:hypothetical protein